jgi:hypothetical protein
MRLLCIHRFFVGWDNIGSGLLASLEVANCSGRMALSSFSLPKYISNYGIRVRQTVDEAGGETTAEAGEETTAEAGEETTAEAGGDTAEAGGDTAEAGGEVTVAGGDDAEGGREADPRPCPLPLRRWKGAN